MSQGYVLNSSSFPLLVCNTSYKQRVHIPDNLFLEFLLCPFGLFLYACAKISRDSHYSCTITMQHRRMIFPLSPFWRNITFKYVDGYV